MRPLPSNQIGRAMNAAKKALTSAKDKIVENKTKILAVTTVAATGAAVLLKIGLKQHDEFLKEKGLYDEFYTPEDDEN
uniref:Uncharacterized protein n=1 Tax=Streptomyces phage TaidaOne TaxID=2836025 RepID=A0A8F3IMG2_9CAUD